MTRPIRRQKGFSLIELITVVVVLSVVAAISVGFVVDATDSYQRTQTRAALVNTARASLEQMTRQLRGALPYSVRVTNSGACIEFMPIAGGGFYREPVPDEANGAPAHTSIDTAPHEVNFGDARYLSIGALASDEIYGASPGALAAIDSRSATQVSFASRTWVRNSVAQRFYLLDEPRAFCLFDSQLRVYRDQSLTGGVDPNDDYRLLARNAGSPGTPFALSAASESRNVRVTLNLDFSEGGETMSFEQEVLLRNVP